ncbi:hypothetical protein Ple7327_2269 [Pleurocapsa sp. PCC 7327]|nr:hypothetical protein Ple7327_2269 [Pleurocapsa sp. PCC 7327]
MKNLSLELVYSDVSLRYRYAQHDILTFGTTCQFCTSIKYGQSGNDF